VGRLAALLGSRLWAATLGLFALLVVYYEVAPHLWAASVWWDVAWLDVVLIPAVFGLVLLALPLWQARGLLPVGLAFAALAAVLTYADIHVFAKFAFPVPGEHAAANLGVPDLLFFALFLAAAARFGLRVHWTFVTLVTALGLTIAATVWWNLRGLPALPAIAIGFLLPNADLLWRRLRRRVSDTPAQGEA
jgi:hypothetical protein